MKKYPNFDERMHERQQALQDTYDQLVLFQELLRSEEALNVLYHGKALEIAEGLQAWIEALELSLQK